MRDVYIIIYDSETMFEVTPDPILVVRRLIERGYSYDDMLLFKAKEIDFTVDFTNMEIKLKDA